MSNLTSNNENIKVSYSVFIKDQKILESFDDSKLQIPQIGLTQITLPPSPFINLRFRERLFR